MDLSYILPLEDTDYVSLSRVYASFVAGSLIIGQPLWAAVSSSFALYFLQGKAYQARSSRKNKAAKALEIWLTLIAISVGASVGSRFLLFVSSRQNQEDGRSYQTWFFAQAIQKLWAVVLVKMLYQDLTAPEVELEAREGADGQRRVRRLKRQESLAMILYELRIKIMKGRNLVPKDTNIFGRKVSSDPYVCISFGPNRMGKTTIVPKSLNPTWPNHIFRMTVIPASIKIYKEIECNVFDHDLLSSDDAMGTVHVPVPTAHNAKVVAWYPVGKGEGDNFCHNAKGELLVEIEVIARD